MPSGVYNRTPEHNANLSKAGKRYWSNVDDADRCKRFTDECKAKMSASHIGMKMPDELRERLSIVHKKRLSKLSKEERSERCKRWQTSGVISSQRTNISSIELKVMEQLDFYRIRYVHQKALMNGMFIVDFWLPEYHLVMECNGDYWHARPERVERDRLLEDYVLSKGKDILWLWEHEINDEWFDISDYLEV